jgi:hypothetical protein
MNSKENDTQNIYEELKQSLLEIQRMRQENMRKSNWRELFDEIEKELQEENNTDGDK